MKRCMCEFLDGRDRKRQVDRNPSRASAKAYRSPRGIYVVIGRLRATTTNRRPMLRPLLPRPFFTYKRYTCIGMCRLGLRPLRLPTSTHIAEVLDELGRGRIANQRNSSPPQPPAWEERSTSISIIQPRFSSSFES